MRYRCSAAAALMALGAAAGAQHANAAGTAEYAYIGTYTPNPSDPRAYAHGSGEGIYLVNVDDATGALSGLKLVAQDRSPAWFDLSPDHKFLYTVNEIDNYGPDKSGSVTAYAVDTTSGALRKLNTVDSGGASGLMGLASWIGVQGERETSDSVERTRRVGNRVVHEQRSKTGGSHEYGVLLGDRFMVTASGNGVEFADLEAAVSRLDLERLEGLRNSGVQ